MPELPEVETTVRGLALHLENRILTGVRIARPDMRRPFPEGLGQALVGARVTGLGRRAKFGLIHTNRDQTLIFHLGMSGRWRIDPDSPDQHDHLTIETETNRFALNDPRRFGFDGDPRSIWHTQFQPKLEKHPHELVVDLGAEYEITGLRYLARQDGGWNGAFAKWEIAISSSPKEFDAPVGIATFKKLRTAQSADFKATKGRYVQIRILTEVNGGPWASAAEIRLVGERSNAK